MALLGSRWFLTSRAPAPPEQAAGARQVTSGSPEGWASKPRQARWRSGGSVWERDPRPFQPVKNRSEKALGAGVLWSRDARSGMLHSPEPQSKPGGRFGLRPGKYLEAGFQAGGQGLSVAQQPPSSSFAPPPCCLSPAWARLRLGSPWPGVQLFSSHDLTSEPWVVHLCLCV